MAAGLGFKTFTTGEVLTAADVNGYLMQGVLVFANAAARTSAITSPQEGQYSFLKDTNALEYYDGAAWVGAPVGDITAVTAGTGISGGGSSGAVTITNSMATEIDAKGDLVVGTGADTFARLAVGTNNYVLTAASGEATGLKWAAAAGGGKVLQVIQTVYSTEKAIASTSYTDTDLSASITPSSATSKVLVIVSQQVIQTRSAQDIAGMAIRIYRGASSVYEVAGTDNLYAQYMRATGATAAQLSSILSLVYLDSPSTTSATTYKTMARLENTTSSANSRFQTAGASSSITLMEIGA